MKTILYVYYQLKIVVFFIASILFYPFELMLNPYDRLKFAEYCIKSFDDDINKMYEKGLITKERRDELLGSKHG